MVEGVRGTEKGHWKSSYLAKKNIPQKNLAPLAMIDVKKHCSAGEEEEKKGREGIPQRAAWTWISAILV